MFCEKCEQEKSESNFFLGGKKCTKCIYEEKKAKFCRKSAIPCRICGELCPEGRSAYCSKECSAIGIDRQKREYWTRAVPSV